MKRRDLIKALEKAGYTLQREGANHSVYGKPGKVPEPIPRHREIKEALAQKILERAGQP
jgi:mRNA interferase HicA